MTFQIQKDYNKMKKYIYINEKEDKKFLIDKQEFKNIKHDMNNITNCMSPRCRKKIVCHDNTTQHQPNQNKRRREIYEQTKDYLNTKK